MNIKQLLLAFSLVVAVSGVAACSNHSDALKTDALINRIDSEATKLEQLAKSGTHPSIKGPLYVVEPHIFWELDLTGANLIQGTTGGAEWGDSTIPKSADPVWSANSVVFYKENLNYESTTYPTRATGYYSAWVVNLKTGKSTAWFLGRTHKLFMDEDGHKWSVDSGSVEPPTGMDELQAWFRGIQHR
jgi:hypothetical protein